MMFETIREDGSPLIVGILNVTPDSFSDGGRYDTLEDACAHAVSMVAEGADIIDVGGESTRPGSSGVDEDTQIERVIPVLDALASRLPPQVPISIDTRSPHVAARAIEAGARLINDISAASAPGMLELAAESGAGIVLMHMQGTPETMQVAPAYEDVVREVEAFLLGRTDLAVRAGVDPQRIAIDPGIGFGKTRRHNLKLLERLDRLVTTGFPVMLGASRKRFMGAICRETEFGELLGATCATTAIGVTAGVRLFRVHDVKQNRQAADLAWACRRAADSP